MSDRGLDTWRKDQVPVWVEVQRQAELRGEDRRAAYARWVLTEVLGAEIPAEEPNQRGSL
ncbi:hypothetical protein LCGC14_1242920 [marine sediment metagenome]|uniref:Uncharacterized protein n=1 Tax=marine sediment metagenome TaxID=412755 RepID=A0A0F9P9F0_9ZZZZ